MKQTKVHGTKSVRDEKFFLLDGISFKNLQNQSLNLLGGGVVKNPSLSFMSVGEGGSLTCPTSLWRERAVCETVCRNSFSRVRNSRHIPGFSEAIDMIICLIQYTFFNYSSFKSIKYKASKTNCEEQWTLVEQTTRDTNTGHGAKNRIYRSV